MWRKTWLVFSQAVTVAVAVLFVLLTLKPDWLPGGAGGVAGPSPKKKRKRGSVCGLLRAILVALMLTTAGAARRAAIA